MSKLKFKKKICFITSGRADYGLFSRLLLECKKRFNIKIIVTGSHLSKNHGFTIREIRKDGFKNLYKIKIHEENLDTEFDITKSISKTIQEFNKFFQKTQVDLVVVLGDRFEIFSAVSAATIRRIPVAHIHGGETTTNSYDENFRHAITIMSQIHFVSAQKYYDRVVQLGKNPKNVYLTGSLGVSNIKNKKIFLKKEKIEKKFNVKFSKKNIFLIYHPETLHNTYGIEGLINLIQELESFSETSIIAVSSNSDTSHVSFNNLLNKASKRIKNFYLLKSLSNSNYLSILKYCDIIVGNSSSGIIEAPSLYIPTVNIGGRQQGRLRSRTIIDVAHDRKSIAIGILKAFKLIKKIKKNKELFTNPYDYGDAVKNIYKILILKKTYNYIKIKKFYDL